MLFLCGIDTMRECEKISSDAYRLCTVRMMTSICHLATKLILLFTIQFIPFILALTSCVM